ncbi:MAG: hypothetical protein RLZZ565_1399, partial [Planctomycetota bacterium]
MSLTLALAIACLVAEPPVAGGSKGTTSPSAATTTPAADPRDAAVTTFAPTESYEVRDLRGWTVRISPSLRESPELCRQVLELLDHQLFQITRV